ncbi:hypothetical protein SAICODRAFT_32801 [Saitoella complicata NRRL Y-17804]|uniref:uncharacterized protein n=1 Tax=Saitoella complicata (strain BCRC 22490 / CBS 7301 / JCM 7358 / NBRC 10748 / NRRL Y-17804) TaxID=698492 RepID=UPI000867DCC5|nr:uncharacterized protein SAICODRAFT_32801 [Saitoella complicata NRRL Y-17804]ODQ56396.1 hypothetical protein SAICODRAFT_32801 [Saitoella complicata NRRL Y-17804]
MTGSGRHEPPNVPGAGDNDPIDAGAGPSPGVERPAVTGSTDESSLLDKASDLFSKVREL